MKEEILKILKSKSFEGSLASINSNYPNLKQELLIRNSILEELNSGFKNNNSSYKAFAEHPRCGGLRVDLSIIDNMKLDNPFLVEFKYQFTNDYKAFSKFKDVIEHDFQRMINEKQIDLFILVVSSWDKDKKREFDEKWKISPNLNYYLCKDDKWKRNIDEQFFGFKNSCLDKVDIIIDEPFQTTYNFFILSKN